MRFVQRRNLTAKAMKKTCRLLKPDDLKPHVTNLASLRKAVKQLTVAVENLEPKQYPEQAEKGEPDLAQRLSDVGLAQGAPPAQPVEGSGKLFR